MRNAIALFGARLRAMLTSRRLDGELDQELDTHLTLLTEDNIRHGMTPDEARRRAAIRLGNRASLTAGHRDARGLPQLESVLQDVSFSLRLIAKNPWFSSAAIVTLAFGIGVNTMGFAVVNTAFIRGLPFDDPAALHMVSWQTKAGRRAAMSNAEYQTLRNQTTAFATLAAYRSGSMSLSDDVAMPEQAVGSWMSVNGFAVLRQQPLLGRGFDVDDGRSGAEPVVLIGHAIWKNRYGSDPNVLGKPIRLNGQPATIVGVMPERMQFPDNSDIWTPLLEDARDARELNAFGRFEPTSNRRLAQAELTGVAQPLLAADPEAAKEVVGIRVETFNDAFVGGKARTMFFAMMGAVCFVLVIACANVANLLLSRSVGRAREIAIRVSLGATRWRIVRQLLIESTVLSFIGGALGVWLAIASVSVFEAATQGSGKPYWLVFTVDYTVFGYVAAVSVVTAMLFGLAPALHVSKTNNHDVLKEGGRGAVGGRRARAMSGSMVVAELALTAVLLVGAGLMVRSLFKVYALDLGIRTDHLVAMHLDLPEARYASPESRRAFFDLVESRLRSIAGVDAVALTKGVPPFDGGEQVLEVEGQVRADAPLQWVSTVTISPGFFDVVGAAILRGRGFQDADGQPGLETVVINDRLASRAFRGEDPLGKRLRVTRRGAPPGPWRTIVGVSPSIRHGSVQEVELNPVVYLPSGQNPPLSTAFLVRSNLPLESLTKSIRSEVQAVDADQPVLSIQTVDQMLVNERWAYRTFGGVFAFFGVIALVLSAVGLYGVMAYSVSQRTQEIGVRMALGASWRQVMWLVLTRGLRHLGIGLALGLAGALALSRVMQRMLAQIEPADPITFASITVLLSVVAVLACLLPARRAARVDPLIALRAE